MARDPSASLSPAATPHEHMSSPHHPPAPISSPSPSDHPSKPNLLESALQRFAIGDHREALSCCEDLYKLDAFNLENLLLLSGVHFQLRQHSESIFYSQQAIRINPNFAEAYSNLGNALRELGDVRAAIQFYLKAIKLKPRFSDAYNNLACAYMQQGKLRQAVETFQMALVLNPALVDAHNNLGNLHKAQGKPGEAKKAYLEAIRIRPDFAAAWNNLAGVFKDEGDLHTALAYYQEAIRLNPNFADAWSNRGNALKMAGRVEEARKAYEKAIALRPDFAIAHGNLGSLWYEAGQVQKAIGAYKHAIQLEPSFPDAHNNLGNACLEVGRVDDAIACFRACLKLKQDHPHAHNNLGNALKQKNMVKEAIHCYTTACRLMPRFAVAHCNLANLLFEQGKRANAIAHYYEAISIDPNFSDAYCNLGNVLKETDHIEEAIKCYLTALRIKPDFAWTYFSLACAYNQAGQYSDAISCFRKALAIKPNFPDALSELSFALAQVCDWRTDTTTLTAILRQQLGRPGRPCMQPFYSLFHPALTPKEVQEIARRYAEQAQQSVALLNLPDQRFTAKMPEERIRIGYVLASPEMFNAAAALHRTHCRDSFEVVFFRAAPVDLQAAGGSSFSSLSFLSDAVDLAKLSNSEAIKAIRAQNLHVLVNMMGFRKGARTELFAARAAPLQVSALAHLGTMGAPFIDYILADATVLPTDDREFISEAVIQMPDCFQLCDQKHRHLSTSPLKPADLPKRAHFSLPEDAFVFACLSDSVAINADCFSLWCRVLQAVPGSVLWLKPSESPIAAQNLAAEARAKGIPSERLIFAQQAVSPAAIALADLVLDSTVYSDPAQVADALWAGVPVITLPKPSMASRVAESMLKATGLAEMVIASEEEFVRTAARLAADMEQLWRMRKQLEDARATCPLFDTVKWVAHFEAALVDIWKRHEEGGMPQHVQIHQYQLHSAAKVTRN